MSSVKVGVVSFSGQEWFTLQLPRETTIWQLKKLVRTLRGVPKKSQNFDIAGRLAAAEQTLSSFSVDPGVMTLVQSKPSCAFCRAPAVKLKRCSGCDEVYYCGPLCQTFYWPRASNRMLCGNRPRPMQFTSVSRVNK